MSFFFSRLTRLPRSISGASSGPLTVPSISRSQTTTTAAFRMSAPTTTLILCGPSGVGKSTLKEMLIKEFPGKFGFSVSYTTREPREKTVDGVRMMEEDGVDYNFVSTARFEQMIADNEFAEHAVFGRNRYGTGLAHLAGIHRRGLISLLDIEMEGVKQVQASSVAALTIFVTPPSLDELETRLRRRDTDTDDAITQRLQQAGRELDFAAESSAAGRGKLLVNDDLDRAYSEVREWCLAAFPALQPATEPAKPVSEPVDKENAPAETAV